MSGSEHDKHRYERLLESSNCREGVIYRPTSHVERRKDGYERLERSYEQQRTAQERLLDGCHTAIERLRNGYDRLSHSCHTSRYTSLEQQQRKIDEKDPLLKDYKRYHVER